MSYSADMDMSRPVDQTSIMNDSVNQSLLLPQETSVLQKVLPPELSSNNQSNFRF